MIMEKRGIPAHSLHAQRMFVIVEGSYDSIEEWEAEDATRLIQVCTMYFLVYGPRKRPQFTCTVLGEDSTIDDMLQDYLAD